MELRLEEQPPDPATPGVTDYMFRMSGFPLGHSYRFLIKHSGTLEISAIGEGFEAAEGGALIGGAKTTWGGQPASELRELQFSLSNTLPGETWHVAAVSTDGQVRADAVACPRPIEARQGSRRLWFELIDPAAKVFLAQGAGFTPGEKVISVTTSGSEVLTSSPSVCDDGHLPPEIVLPATKGKRGGRGTWTVRTSSGELTLAFPWGREAFR